jgi:hypothetical protein
MSGAKAGVLSGEFRGRARNLVREQVSPKQQPGPRPAALLNDRFVERGYILDDATADTLVADIPQHAVAQPVKVTTTAKAVEIDGQAVR